MRVEIVSLSQEYHQGVVDLAQALPDWFDEDARQRAIPIDLLFQDGFVALVEGRVVGFITLFVAEGRLNIGWMGVLPEHHRQGIGGALLEAAEGLCRTRNIPEIATYTLGDSVEYPPYEATRAFYFQHGFRVFQRSQTDNPGCPEEIKLKKPVSPLGTSPTV